MAAVVAVSAVIVFIFAFTRSGLVPTGNRVLAVVGEALTSMRDDSLDDRARERSIQQASLQLFRSFFSILIRSAAVFLLAVLPLLISDGLGWVPYEDVVRLISRWDFILASTVVVGILYAVRARLKPSSPQAFKVNYSMMDQLIHHVAFFSPSIQLAAADIEKTIMGSASEGAETENPIFITSLPRAGTTLFLNVLSRFPSLATHTYRDMPFVMAPLLWSKLSRAFYKAEALHERAHGDGVAVGYDSPEAFEEVIWRTFWPEKYKKDKIELWTVDDGNDRARRFFIDHMKKIVVLRSTNGRRPCRYLSKNNANIARLDLIAHLFPTADIIVPIRNPLDHSASLLRQHLNFITMHKESPFVRRYMADIGHYEFGDLHKYIDFPETAIMRDRNPLTLDYWLAYWVAAFSYIYDRRNAAFIVPYEAICSEGKPVLRRICSQLGIAEEGLLEAAAAAFRAPKQYDIDKSTLDRKLLSRAEDLYRALIA